MLKLGSWWGAGKGSKIGSVYLEKICFSTEIFCLVEGSEISASKLVVYFQIFLKKKEYFERALEIFMIFSEFVSILNSILVFY